ncbi:histone-fold-containing protein [Zychaea mexicana]|uniref:histone-fold-containing protein n=1 Tax=Zychaea mexicana TaxID=64656 RepID=UPI0022FEB025|nr:histone-fold-containing protein [Zychaea mexicana]KAI9488400.1 histone-fold-containing protein [Zychaea mexicana]
MSKSPSFFPSDQKTFTSNLCLYITMTTGNSSMQSSTTTSGGSGGKTSSTFKKIKTDSGKAGLQFPVGRLRRYLKKGRYTDRVSGTAPIYLAGVLEYLTAEIVELAGNAARDNKRQRITPRHLKLAIGNDAEFSKLLSHVIIAEGGVLPKIHNELLPEKSRKKDAVSLEI